MQKRVSVYPIYGLSYSWDSDPFDVSLLPFPIYKNVAIEPVADALKTSLGYFEKVSPQEFEKMRLVRFAIVHRYEASTSGVNDKDDQVANQLLHKLAACLRQIRPMRQPAGLMQGSVLKDGSFDITHAESWSPSTASWLQKRLLASPEGRDEAVRAGVPATASDRFPDRT
jgi:hypothetical protein